LATKDELADIADVAGDMFIDVEWDVQTRAGKIALSNELIEDSAIDVVEEVKKQLQRMVVNTNNQNIINLLKGFTKVSATTLDDVKKVFNVDLDPALNKQVIVNQSAFNYLDTLKDVDGRYILQPDLKASSGKSLLGAEVIVVSDALLANGGTQSSPKYPIIVGDFEESVAVFNRNQITAEWQKFDSYSQGLSVVVRNDYKVVDPDATRYIELTPPTQE
jgi:HK97 family phage major capsid protein